VKSLQNNFSHIYIEKNVQGYPLTDLVMKNFSDRKIIWIDHYKDIFNRVGQDFQSQKTTMNLILAKKTPPFLYPASDMVQEFETPNVFYNTPVLNCLYNCEYCFLQGMYPSGNLVVFVNEDDLRNAIDMKLNDPIDPLKPTVVSVSYNTDLLAMENIMPLTRSWIEYARTKKDLLIEIRTKSALFPAIKDLDVVKNVILSWTLSPQIICDRYENTAPPLKSRIRAVKQALDHGWPVRLCFDPVLLVDNWYEVYTEFFNQLFLEIQKDQLIDVTLGVFRMNKDYYKRIRKRDTRSDLYYRDYSVEGNTVAVNKKERVDALHKLRSHLNNFLPIKKILVWK
jgi:spore photoproduct lyase